MRARRTISLVPLVVTLVVAALCLFIGQAIAGDKRPSPASGSRSASTRIGEEQFAPHASSSRSHRRLHVRSGKIVDHDSTPGDGNFNFATGHARCKHGERLVDGGIRRIGNAGLIPGLHWAVQESGPVPSKREWVVTAASDLGGLGRKDFIVIAVCE